MARSTWATKGALAPLFDRLKDTTAWTHEEIDIPVEFNRDQVLASVMQEISLLLNTRAAVSLKDYEYLKTDTRDSGWTQLYGLPDFSFFDGENKIAWTQGNKIIENAIRLFEPRLRNPRARIKEFSQQSQDLSVQISGDLVLSDQIEHVDFPMHLANISLNNTTKYR